MDTPTVAYTERVERELNRLRAARPGMARRVDRAEALLVTQMSVSPAVRPIRVHVAADGSRSYRVRSGSKLGKSYRVDGFTFGCDCPAVKPCYHSIAAYVLDRIMYPAATVKEAVATSKRPVADISAGLQRMAG